MFVNETGRYHREQLDTLGWEMTVCTMLESPDSPCRRILEKNASFGHLLHGHLSGLVPPDRMKRIMEVGGGYGYVMRDFVHADPGIRPVMVDISPYLLDQQRTIVQGHPAEFINDDFLNMDPSFLFGFDAVLFNENLGDFETVCDIDPAQLDTLNPEEFPLAAVKRLCEQYHLSIPDDSLFNFNYGALRAIELVCLAGVPLVYAGEHSCEAMATGRWQPYINITASGNPERIPLKGHDEYTIKFSHLAAVAEYYGYAVHRGNFMDFIRPLFDERIRFILSSASSSDEHEIIRHFLHDLIKYEYIIALK